MRRHRSEQAQALVARTVDELGRLDIVVNNAGVMLLGPIVDAPVEEWDRMIALNVQGLLYVAHAALPHLLEAAADEPAPRRRPREHQLDRGARREQPARASTTSPSTASARSASRCARRSRAATCASALVEPGQVTTELTHHLRDGDHATS